MDKVILSVCWFIACILITVGIGGLLIACGVSSAGFTAASLALESLGVIGAGCLLCIY